MKTFRLWRRLWHPPQRHPLFRHAAELSSRTPLQVPRWAQMMGGLALVLTLCAIWSPALILVMVATLFVSPLVFLLLNGTGYGLLWTVNVSGTIVRFRRRGIYDLLCLTPYGPLGVSWLLCAGSIHRKGGLKQVHGAVRLLLAIGLGATLIISFFVITNLIALDSDNPLVGPATRLVLAVFLVYPLLGALYVDHIQSILLSGLIGMLMPQVARDELDIRFWSAGVFLVVQGAVYILVALVGLVLLPALFRAFGIGGPFVMLSIAALSLLILYGLREGLIRLLWHTLKRRSRADLDLFDLPHVAFGVPQ